MIIFLFAILVIATFILIVWANHTLRNHYLEEQEKKRAALGED